MSSLRGLTVLVVEDHADSREMLEIYLETKGANVRLVGTATEARAVLSDLRVDVILSDATLPGEDGFAFVRSLRANLATRGIPVIAITGQAEERARARAIEAGFQKFLTKPLDILALSTAIASVVESAKTPSATESADQRFSRLLQARDMRTLLGSLNAKTSYRYTSVLRFDGPMLESMWTFDRGSEDSDTFPPDVPIQASYCDLVRESGTPILICDALTDSRVVSHPKRSLLRAYCGVPIFRTNGSMFGTLCHYDEQPRPVVERDVEEMLGVAKLLTTVVDEASREPPAQPA